MNERSSSTLPRLIAPLAILAAAVALVIVVGTSLDLSGGGSVGSGSTVEAPAEPVQTGVGKRYVVKPGDSLSTIAEETGVPVDELVVLNPDLDPQALSSGASVKLR